jgi:hypothetical protein
LLLIAAPVRHEIRAEAGEFRQDAGEGPTRGPDANFLAHALNLEIDTGPLIGQLGRNADCLGITVAENLA